MSQYYFAYGSNMSHQQMAERCPGALFVGAVRLDGYAFIYDGYAEWRKGAVGNVVPRKGAHVWGGLYEMTPENVARMDRYEDVPVSYQRYDDLTVHTADGTEYTNVLVYRRAPQEPGRPSDAYRTTILAGAKDCGLPVEYVSMLASA